MRRTGNPAEKALDWLATCAASRARPGRCPAPG